MLTLWRRNIVKLIDANVILRYLTGMPEDQAAVAREVIEAGTYTTMEVISEVVYVLQRNYSFSRDKIATAIINAMSEIAMPEPYVLAYALIIYRARTLDFVDCVLAARTVINHDEVFTFDKKLISLIRQLDELSQ